MSILSMQADSFPFHYTILPAKKQRNYEKKERKITDFYDTRSVVCPILKNIQNSFPKSWI